MLASVFSHSGGFANAHAFVDGLTPALWIGATIVGAGALAACVVKRTGRPSPVMAQQLAANRT